MIYDDNYKMSNQGINDDIVCKDCQNLMGTDGFVRYLQNEIREGLKKKVKLGLLAEVGGAGV